MADYWGESDKIQKNSHGRAAISYMSGRDIMADPITLEWIIEGMIAMGESLLIHAKGGLGKSMFVQFLFLAIASWRDAIENALGDLFLGEFSIPQRRCTLFIGSENGRITTYQRLSKMCSGPNSFENGLDNVFFLSQYGDTTLSGEVFLDESFCEFLIEFIKKIEAEQNVKIEILVIDPLISFTGAGDENNSAEMRPALDAIDVVCKRCGCTPVVIHHDKKEGGEYRGSTAINDWARSRISLQREFIKEDRITDVDIDGKATGRRQAPIPVIRVTHRKCNNFKMFEPFLVRLDDHLHFNRIDEQLSPEEAEKANSVAQALLDMGGYAQSTNDLAKIYQELSGIGKTAAKKHIALAADNGFVSRHPVTKDGKPTYEYKTV